MREIDKKYLPKEKASGLKQKPGSEILAQKERVGVLITLMGMEMKQLRGAEVAATLSP